MRKGALALLIGILGAVPAMADAEARAPTPSVQAWAADAAWLAYAPPPPHPGVVCLVDSGVDLNPDTQPIVIARDTIESAGGVGDALDGEIGWGSHPLSHGTLMAMLMASPENGWGMVGIAPQAVRIYSVRGIPAGETTFPFSSYSVAINRCIIASGNGYPGITTISLSLGGTATPSTQDLSGLENAVTIARGHRLSIVAAAGNGGTGVVDYPAAYGEVLGVGATDAMTGAVCPFTNNGPGIGLLAPGCDAALGGIEAAFPDDGSPSYAWGTSDATAIAAALLAAMRAYRPSLTDTSAERCLTETASGAAIDAAAAFRDCGLGNVVATGQAALASALAAPPIQAVAPEPTGPAAAEGPVQAPVPAPAAHARPFLPPQLDPSPPLRRSRRGRRLSHARARGSYRPQNAMLRGRRRG